MKSREFAQHAFAVLMRGLAGSRADMNCFVDLFAPDARVWLPATPNTRSPYVGDAAIRSLLVDFVPALYRDGLHMKLYHVLESDDRVLFQFQDYGVRQDGSEYHNSPCIALGVANDQITGFWEYWGGPQFFEACFDGSGAGPGANVDTQAQAVAELAVCDLQRGLTGDAVAMESFLARLADDVCLWFPPTPNTHSPYTGRAAAARLFRELLLPMYPQGLFTRRFHTLAGGSRRAFEMQSFGVRADSSEYINSPCLCIDIKQDKIAALWEHWGGPGCFDPNLRAIFTT